MIALLIRMAGFPANRERALPAIPSKSELKFRIFPYEPAR